MDTPPLMVLGAYGLAIHAGERNDHRRREVLYRPRSVYALWVVLDGRARLLAPGVAQVLALPAAVLLFPGDDHSIEITGGSSWRSLRFDVVQVPRVRKGPGAYHHRREQPQPAPRAVWGCEPQRVIAPERVAACRRMVERCVAIYWRSDLGYAQANADLASWLIGHVAASASREDDALGAAARAVRDRPPGQGVVASMAQAAGLCRQRFSARFTQEHGLTPRAFAIGERLRRARDLLRHSDLGVDAIAKQCGYRSTAAFIRRFSVSEGLPPGRWRRTAAAG